MHKQDTPRLVELSAASPQAKHKNASPLIVEAAELDGGLYELYRSLDTLQTWRRPESGEEEETVGETAPGGGKL